MNMFLKIPSVFQPPVVFIGVALAWLWVHPIQAAMLLHIESVLPRVGQRGTTVEVTIQGMCLKNPREIVFYRQGIRALSVESLPNLPHPIGLAHGGRIEEQVRCKFEIAPDCPPGEHPFRLRTATEISSLGTFHVSPFPVIDENEKGYNSNDTLQTALSVPGNVTVRGQMGPGSKGDVDMYRVPAKAGQRLSVEVDSVRIADIHYGGSEYDLALRILDESGKELASNDDNSLHLQDPLVSVKLPRDGFVFVEVRRSVFVPDDRAYCVHIGQNRRALAAFPMGGMAGTDQKIRMIGDPLGDFQETVQIPQAQGSFEWFGDSPSPLLLRSSSYPNVMEASSQPFTPVSKLPAALNGIISGRGEKDAWRVFGKKGERWRVRVYSASLGSPLDPKIRIHLLDKSDKPVSVVAEGDDAQLPDRDIFGTSFRSGGGLKDILDPSILWEPKVDSFYMIEMEDPSGSGGPTGVYRIEVEPATDSVHTLLASTAFDWMECIRTSGLAIPQGNRFTVNIHLPRGQGTSYRGELDLVAHGLPKGVHLVTGRIPGGRTVWPVQFVAESTATPGTSIITLEARAVDPNVRIRNGSQQNIPFINHPGGDAWRTVKLDRYALAITDAAPFSIKILPPPVALVRGGELAIPVKITRRPGFQEAVEFECDWVPPGVGVQPRTVIPAGESSAILRIAGDANAPLGRTPLVVVASTVREELDGYLGTGRIRVSSELVDLNIAEPFVELSSVAESIRRGEKKRYIWSVKQKSPFDGTASVNLLGLPKGVNIVGPAPALSRESQSIAFELEATDDALLGSVRGISCEVIVRAGGQEIRQRTGSGTLRIDPKK